MSHFPVSELLHIGQSMSTASHPQTDGETERANRTLEDILRQFVNPAQTDWDVKLPCCESAVNNSWNRATGSTPFFFNHGDHPRTPVNVDVVTPLPAANAFVGRMMDAVSRARASLLYAQHRMSHDADQASRNEKLEVGGFVLLSTKFLPLSHLGRNKLLSKYLRPFEVMSKKSAVAYKLRLPASMSRMLNVFHVSLLMRYKDGCRGYAPPPAVLGAGEVECEIDNILAHRVSKTGRRSYYVQWKGLPPEENEWLTASKLKNAADVVQDYLDDLSNNSRPAARVGRPERLLLNPFRILQLLILWYNSLKVAMQRHSQGRDGVVPRRQMLLVILLFRSAAEANLESSTSVLQCCTQSWLFVRVCVA